MRFSKLVIGGAQFGQSYGIDSRKVNQKEIKKLFKYLKKQNRKIIYDSSPNYGDSEKIILKMGLSNSSIITKIKDIPKELDKIKTYIEKFVIDYKKKNQKNIYAILLHDEKELSNFKRLQFITKIFIKMKKHRLIKKYGFSIYDYKRYRKNILRAKPDILQFPYNIIDDRIKDYHLKELKKKNIILHARSVFLQGLLLCESAKLPKKFKRFKKTWEKYEKELKKNDQTMLQACLGHVLFNKYLDKIVIGFKSLKQLKEIDKIKLVRKNFFFPRVHIQDKLFLINPYKW